MKPFDYIVVDSREKLPAVGDFDIVNVKTEIFSQVKIRNADMPVEKCMPESMGILSVFSRRTALLTRSLLVIVSILSFIKILTLLLFFIYLPYLLFFL